jgi:hypothetical protein
MTTAQLKSGLQTGFDPTVWGIAASINDGYPYLKALPPPAVGLNCPLQIDCQFITAHEGGLFLYPYIPANYNSATNTSVVRGSSGVTVSVGVDMGKVYHAALTVPADVDEPF